MSYNTYITFDGDGSTKDFAIPFTYLKQEDVVVTRQNGPVSFVFLSQNIIRLSIAIDVGDLLTIERRTSISAPSVVFNNGSSFTGDNINNALTQLRFALQEATDRTGTVYASVYDINSIDSLFNSTLTQFTLSSGGSNLGQVALDSGLWVVSLNGSLLEPVTDYTISVVSGAAKITFVEAPQAADNSSLKFIRFYDGIAAGGGGGEATAFTLDDLDDVTINAPTNGQYLVYNGTMWVNGSGAGGSSGIEIVTTTPNSCSVSGKSIYNSTDGKLYVCKANVYVDIITAYTPDAPNGIAIVDTLPGSGAEGTVVFLRTDNKLYKRVSGAWVSVVAAIDVASTVADASITTAKFASGIRPVEIVSTLPTTSNFEGRMVFLTTDDKLYRHNGTAFTAGTAAGDLTGQIGADQIAANAITAGKIAAGAISATEIASGAITTAKLFAGSITSDKIAALAVTANAIAADAITTDKLAANSITAGKIQAAAIGTTQLAANAITADKLAANTVLIGSAQIADASITTLKIGGNQVTQAQAFNRGAYVEAIGGGYTSVLSGSVSVSGTQPIIVMVTWTGPNQRVASSSGYDFFESGQYWYVNQYLTGQNARVSLGGQTSAIEGLTLMSGGTATFSFIAMFTGVSAGTHTLSLQLQTYSGQTAVRTANMVFLETKR